MEWHTIYTKYFALHYQLDYWLSFGVHIDLKRRTNASKNINFGPYIDIHFLCFILSFGYNPIYSTCAHALTFRAGESE